MTVKPVARTNGDVDIVGLARVMILDPELPTAWIQESSSATVSNPSFPRFAETPEGGVAAWHTMPMVSLGEDSNEQTNLDLHKMLHIYAARDEQRCDLWSHEFTNID